MTAAPKRILMAKTGLDGKFSVEYTVAAALLALLMTLLAGSRGRDPHTVDAEGMP